MNIVTLLKRKPTDREKQISDVANKILATFIDALQSADFRYVRFHTYPTNDPNGFRVFSVQYTSADILGHPAVKELLSKEAPHDFKCQS